MMKKFRLSIVLGELILGAIALVAMQSGLTEVAVGAVTGLVALLPKIIESEEKTIQGKD